MQQIAHRLRLREALHLHGGRQDPPALFGTPPQKIKCLNDCTW